MPHATDWVPESDSDGDNGVDPSIPGLIPAPHTHTHLPTPPLPYSNYYHPSALGILFPPSSAWPSLSSLPPTQPHPALPTLSPSSSLVYSTANAPPSLAYTSLLAATGNHSRLRRRGAIRLGGPGGLGVGQAVRPDEDGSESELEEGEGAMYGTKQTVALCCGKGIRRPLPFAGPSSSSFTAYPLPHRPPSHHSQPTPQPRPLGGCGALIHLSATDSPSLDRRGGREWSATVPPTDGVVRLRKRKRMGCGCERVGVGCRRCGNTLGTYLIHLCRPHLLPLPLSTRPHRTRRASMSALLRPSHFHSSSTTSNATTTTTTHSTPTPLPRWHFKKTRVFPRGAPLLPAYTTLPDDSDDEFEDWCLPGEGGKWRTVAPGEKLEEGVELYAEFTDEEFDPDGEGGQPGSPWGEKEVAWPTR